MALRRIVAQGLSFLLYFGGEVQITDSNGNIFRNLSNAAYVGSFQALSLPTNTN